MTARAPIEIRRWTDDALLFASQTARSIRQAVEQAVDAEARLDGASLDGASLDGASLVGARLDGARLDGASLVGARLDGARLDGARLDGASLVGASLDGARLDGASLDGARLDGASLVGASLVGASLDRASLDRADLSRIRDDLRSILDARPVAEARGLLLALEEGRVDGSQYEGECACLVGTLANVAGVDYRKLEGVSPNSGRPAEIWFLAILQGDTPENNVPAAIAADWIREWLAERPAPGEAGPPPADETVRPVPTEQP